MEQQAALDSAYGSSTVQRMAQRVMYLCTSCALAGKPVPLRPQLRYSLLNERFTCLTCHRSQRQRSGNQQSRRDKGAKLVSRGTSVVCIDMIGKALYTSMDLPVPLWRCYVFCVKCSRVHEFQDGPPSACPLSPIEVTPPCHRYHMMPPPCMPVFIDQGPLHVAARERKRGCCLCVSTSSSCRVEVMVRRCEGDGMPVTYCLEHRSFCARHSPPQNLASAGCFIDEVQLMEFCSARRRGVSH